MRFIVSAFLLAMFSTVSAARLGALEKRYTIEVPMNDATSRAGAREIALARARQMASSEFGSAVLTQEELRDGDLRERTRVVTAGLSKLQVLSESFKEDEKGVLSGQFVVEARIEGDELDRQLEAARRDASRDQRLLTLARENEVLKAELKERDSTVRPETMVKKDLLRHAPVVAGEPITFARGKLAEDAVRNNHEVGWFEEIESRVFTPMRRATYSIRYVGAEPQGNDVVVTLAARWDVDLSHMMADVISYLLPDPSYRSTKSNLCFMTSNLSDFRRTQLEKQALWLELTVGKKIYNYSVVGKKTGYPWCVSSTMGRGSYFMKIRMTADEAKDAGEIKSRLIRGSIPENLQRSDLLFMM